MSLHEPTPEDVAAAPRCSTGPWRASRTGAAPAAGRPARLLPSDRRRHRHRSRARRAAARGDPDRRPAGPPALPRVHPGDADRGRRPRRHGALGGHGLRRQPAGGSRRRGRRRHRPSLARGRRRLPADGRRHVRQRRLDRQPERAGRGARRPVRLAAPPGRVTGHSAHSSLAAAARVLGCDLVVADPGRRPRPSGRAPALRAALEGHDAGDVVAVVATAGATNNGAVDDLAAVAGVCAEAGVWLHVDGAYGGAALLSPAHARPVRRHRARRLVHREPAQVAVPAVRLRRGRLPRRARRRVRRSRRRPTTST